MKRTRQQRDATRMMVRKETDWTKAMGEDETDIVESIIVALELKEVIIEEERMNDVVEWDWTTVFLCCMDERDVFWTPVDEEDTIVVNELLGKVWRDFFFKKKFKFERIFTGSLGNEHSGKLRQLFASLEHNPSVGQFICKKCNCWKKC